MFTYFCLSEIQGVWAGSTGGGDWWAAVGEETGKEHGRDVSQESPGYECTEFSPLQKKKKKEMGEKKEKEKKCSV